MSLALPKSSGWSIIQSHAVFDSGRHTAAGSGRVEDGADEIAVETGSVIAGGSVDSTMLTALEVVAAVALVVGLAASSDCEARRPIATIDTATAAATTAAASHDAHHRRVDVIDQLVGRGLERRCRGRRPWRHCVALGAMGGATQGLSRSRNSCAIQPLLRPTNHDYLLRNRQDE
jgi:hypothetical protein